MSLNNTPSANRIHIGIFGRRNCGKSSLINALTGQTLSIVSDTKGTTTDPVLKAMELLPLGPVIFIDTAGLDDVGDLGQLRIAKTYQMLNKTDIALLVVDNSIGMTTEDNAILKKIEKKQIPYLVVYNKCDIGKKTNKQLSKTSIEVSAKTGFHMQELKERIATLLPINTPKVPIVRNLLSPNDFVILVVPIDSAAPKGRLILPQQQTIREILDANAISIVVKDTELKNTLEHLGKTPRLVITDSQAFKQVSEIVPQNIWLTSFSILFARYKGNLKTLINGAFAIDQLKNGDTVLISEGCTHHRQCGDIGTVKLPNLLKQYTKKELNFVFTSGEEFPLDLTPYHLIIHCGGCMLNEREMKYRIRCAYDEKIPITNYGIAIAKMNGILERSLEPFTHT
ncbi:[FeFe] hydrogenase H-cluster maturation GTPase HydF [Faecalimonas sp.]